MSAASVLEILAGLFAVLGLVEDRLSARLACVGVLLLALALLIGARL